jgi:hypothetical protein
MELACPRCRTMLGADDANLESGIGRCRDCNRVFSLYDQIRGQFTDGQGALRPRPHVPLPVKLSLDATPTTLTISWRWFHPAVLFLLFFVIAWDSFLVVWYGAAFSLSGPGVWLMTLFPIAHLAVGVGLTYFVVASFLNRTTISVEGGVLSVRHGPLPWRGNLSLPSRAVEQLYVAETSAGSGEDKARRLELRARLRDNSEKALLKSLTDASQALYLEQELERFLRIRDAEVAGELPRA